MLVCGVCVCLGVVCVLHVCGVCACGVWVWVWCVGVVCGCVGGWCGYVCTCVMICAGVCVCMYTDPNAYLFNNIKQEVDNFNQHLIPL